MSGTGEPVIRTGRDSDAEGFIALIGACWSEYPGIVLDVDRELPELRALASYMAGKAGSLWAAEAAGGIVGMVTAYPEQINTWAISRMYVQQPWRGTGLAARLLGCAESHAVAAGAERIELWSDTRFRRGHRFYERRGYLRSSPVRALRDLSNTIEFHYVKPVRGVERLDAGAAASAELPLAELLRTCVDAGASVSFLPPLPIEHARAFWRRSAAETARGARIMLAAWTGAELVGVVTLDLGMPPNQPHRAEVQKLLVHPAARGCGIGRALMHRVEREAWASGRTLLTLDTRAGDAAEALYRKTGWTEAGRIPGFALSADRALCETVLFYKRLEG
jgi:GNAT superfamily N-acetyltransferase